MNLIDAISGKSVDIEILSLYVDPFMVAEISCHEDWLLKRISEADFPTLVYRGEEFNPRTMGIQMPRVVYVQNE